MQSACSSNGATVVSRAPSANQPSSCWTLCAYSCASDVGDPEVPEVVVDRLREPLAEVDRVVGRAVEGGHVVRAASPQSVATCSPARMNTRSTRGGSRSAAANVLRQKRSTLLEHAVLEVLECWTPPAASAPPCPRPPSAPRARAPPAPRPPASPPCPAASRAACGPSWPPSSPSRPAAPPPASRRRPRRPPHRSRRRRARDRRSGPRAGAPGQPTLTRPGAAGAGAPPGLQNRRVVAAPRLEGSTPSPLRRRQRFMRGSMWRSSICTAPETAVNR